MMSNIIGWTIVYGYVGLILFMVGGLIWESVREDGIICTVIKGLGMWFCLWFMSTKWFWLFVICVLLNDALKHHN